MKLDCFLQGLHIELPGVCHKPNIVKVLYAAVADVEHNHCMEFVGRCVCPVQRVKSVAPLSANLSRWLRASKAIQEAFYCEPPQHPLVIFISALCERKQSGSNGGW